MRILLITAVAASFVALSADSANAQQLLSGGDYVKAHNDFREKHCVPPLTKSATLEAAAAAWAKQLAEKDEFEHADNLAGIGENLFTAGRSGEPYANDGEVHTTAAGEWYAEIKDYKFSIPTPHSDKTGVVGHFTQMIWKSSTEVGCANVSYSKDDMHKVVSVCRYAPGGNDVSNDGALYKDNVPAVCK